MKLLSMNESVTLFEAIGLPFKPRPVGSAKRQIYVSAIPQNPGSYQAPAAENHTISLSRNSLRNMSLDSGWVGKRPRGNGQFMFLPARTRMSWDIPSPKPGDPSQSADPSSNFFLSLPCGLLRSKIEDYTREEVDPDHVMKGLVSKPSNRFAWFEQQIFDELMSGKAGRDCILDTLVDALLVEMIDMYLDPDRPGPALTFSEAEAEIIEREIAESIDTSVSIRRLSDGLGLTPSTFTRRFSATFHATPTQYVLNRRLSRAKQLLETTDLPIAEIAYASGFSSQAHLTSRFSATYGVSPGRHRMGTTDNLEKTRR